jgi:exodeoxyribonuclease V
LKKIDNEIIRPLWRQWNKLFIDQFANVNYGNSHSVHKSQGSSFYNVFVDSDDILNNPNQEEAKRCIYTAFTRSSNELHILI